MHKKVTLEEDIHRMMAHIDEKDDALDSALLDDPEQLETYHIYPMAGGIYITREEEEPIKKQNVDSSTETAGTGSIGFVIWFLALLLPLSCIALQLYLVLYPITAIVSIVPQKQIFAVNETMKIVPETPRAGEIQGRLIPAITLSQSAQTLATGKGHQDAAKAHGFITFYNGQFSSQTVAAGTIFTSSTGIQIGTDENATIPAANPPIFGQVTVSAHAIHAGTQGNIAAYDIHEACCSASVLAKNTAPFTGGQDERTFTILTQKDINSVSTVLKTSLTQSMQGALETKVKGEETLLPFPCTTTTRPDHRANEEATYADVTVSQTCSGIVYDIAALQQRATTILSVKAEHQLGTHYQLLGDVQVTRIQPIQTNTTFTLSISAQSVWIYSISQSQERSLKQKIAGSPVHDALTYLSAIPGIQRAAIQGIEDSQKLPKSVSAIRIVIIE